MNNLLKQFCGVYPEDFEIWLLEQKEKKFVSQQVFEWVYKHGVLDWYLMTNLRKSLQCKLANSWTISSIQLIKSIDSKDQETSKFLWKLKDGAFVESVLIRSGKRRTVCVSTQVGCPVRCAFCASGLKGLVRDLSPAEIVEQVVHINKVLKLKEEKVSHIVFMGMGEPLENYNATVHSINILKHIMTLNISHRRITVSTVGIINGIRKLANEHLNVNLSLSLHAPNQQIRKKLIPYARKNSFTDIIKATDYYAAKTKRNMTYEYVLIKGINDTKQHADELVQLVKRKPITINLIPHNHVNGIPLKRPSNQSVKCFYQTLVNSGVVTTCRYTKGDDIMAACGQLVQYNDISSII